MTVLAAKSIALLAGARNGISKIRELVLDLALRGKLAMQSAEDGSASDLLGQIEHAKTALIGCGLLKAQKELPGVTASDVPFALPADWVWTRLGSITNFGSTDKRGAIEPESWILDLEDIEKETSKLLRKARYAERQSLSDKNGFAAGDVLYGKLRPYLNKVVVADEAGFCTTEILPFRCHGPWHAGYFKIALQSPYFLSYVNGKSYGMKMPRLGTEDGRMAALPLPPLAEQHRIVAKVDELMALCDRLEAQQADAEAAHAQLVKALLASLTQAHDPADFRASWQQLSEHFHTLFTTEASIDALKQTVLQLGVMGKLVAAMNVPNPVPSRVPAIATEDEPFEVPAHWRWDKLGSLCDLVTSGSRGWKEFYADKGSVFIRSQDIKADRLVFDNKAHVQLPPSAEGARTLVSKDDLLMTITGANVGKAAHITEEITDAYVSQHVALIRPRPGQSNSFLHRWLINSQGGRSLLLASSYGAKPGLNLQNIKDLPVPIPPLAEQHRIVAKVDELLALCEQLKLGLTDARQHHAHLAAVLVEQAVAT